MAKATTKTVTKKVTAKKVSAKRAAPAAKRAHFSIRAIRNANPRVARSTGVFARIFSL